MMRKFQALITSTSRGIFAHTDLGFFYLIKFSVLFQLRFFFLPGSSAAFMTALFMMCVACLVGTALMAFKKSRDEPIGYTVLATGDQK